MTMYGGLAISTLGMMVQSYNMATIGTNVANVNTGGYKRTDAQFKTVLGNTYFEQSDIGGVQVKSFQRLSQQGSILASDREMDVALSGKGFLVLNSAYDGTGEALYGRDGSFVQGGGESTTAVDENGDTISLRAGYLADKNGYFVQGWTADSTGAIDTAGSVSSLRIDAYATSDSAAETTEIGLDINIPGDASLNDAFTYSASMYDTGGNVQSAIFQFTKTGTNAWDLTVTRDGPAVAQVDTVTLAGTVEAGDTYSVTVSGNTVNYTVQATDTTLNDVATGLAAAIAANATVSAIVTADASGGNPLTLTAVNAGTQFLATASAANGAVAVAQVDSVTMAGSVEAGDIYRATINGVNIDYTVTGAEPNLNAIRDGLIAAINGSGQPVTAAPTGAGTFTITANVAGTSFTSATSIQAAGGTADNTISVSNTTPNTASTADNTASSLTTTANQTKTTVTAATQALTFDGSGAITGTDSVDLNMTWNNGETTTATLDLSDVTQFASIDLMERRYTFDGHAAGNLREISFAQNGDIIGHFNNGRSRPIYRVALAVFSNADGMTAIDGNVYKANGQSGDATLVSAGVNGYALFVPNAREMSNVDIGSEFTKMMITQTAYKSSATVFKTVDEMYQVARDLKR